MEKSSAYIRKSPGGIIFKICVQPKSSKNLIVGQYGDELKIKLTAPPVDNAANRMCIQFLAKQLAVPKTAIEIIAGQTSRHKKILINYTQTEPAETEYRRLEQRISELLSDE